MKKNPQSLFHELVKEIQSYAGCRTEEFEIEMYRRDGIEIPDKLLPGRMLERMKKNMTDEEKKALKEITSDMAANTWWPKCAIFEEENWDKEDNRLRDDY